MGGILVLVLVATGSVHARSKPATISAEQADVVLTGEADGDRAGFQLGVGDLDGDGLDDLVVSAFAEQTKGPNTGAVYIVYGPVRRSATLADADAKLVGARDHDYTGEGPFAVADLDGDGADDLVVGAPGSYYVRGGTPRPGEAFVVYGGKRLTGTRSFADVADATFVGIHPVDWVGMGVRPVGDLDADGFDDIMVGATGTAAHSGAAYLVYGSKKRLQGPVSVMESDAQFSGGLPTEQSGYQAEGGDIDGDGLGDLMIRSLPPPYAQPQPGRIYVFYGQKERFTGRKLLPAADSILLTHPGEPQTRAVSVNMHARADLNRDGVDDLVVGDPSAVNAETTDHTYVIFGGEHLTGIHAVADVADLVVTGPGTAVTAGRVGAGRSSDLVTSAVAEGATYVFAGPFKPGRLDAAAAETTVVSDDAATEAGSAVAIGDFNRDRRPDLVIGAPGGTGRVYILYGARERRRSG